MLRSRPMCPRQRAQTCRSSIRIRPPPCNLTLVQRLPRQRPRTPPAVLPKPEKIPIWSGLKRACAGCSSARRPTCGFLPRRRCPYRSPGRLPTAGVRARAAGKGSLKQHALHCARSSPSLWNCRPSRPIAARTQCSSSRSRASPWQQSCITSWRPPASRQHRRRRRGRKWRQLPRRRCCNQPRSSNPSQQSYRRPKSPTARD
jgi:hypothetical protein